MCHFCRCRLPIPELLEQFFRLLHERVHFVRHGINQLGDGLFFGGWRGGVCAFLAFLLAYRVGADAVQAVHVLRHGSAAP